MQSSSMTRQVVALALVLMASHAFADPGDETCFPAFREAGAVPGTSSCPLDASQAPVGMGSYYCTAGNDYIDRYCGIIPKDLDQCPKTPYPISIGNGNKSLMETDLAFPAKLLSVRRYYNSSAAAAGGNLLGQAWGLAFEPKILTTTSGAGAQRADGQILYFTQSGTNFVPDADVNDRLVRVPATGTLTGWLYYDMSQSAIENYDDQGHLLKVTTLDGKSASYSYSTSSTPSTVAPGAGYLIGVNDAFGHSVSFVYGTNGLIASVSTPAAAGLVQYAYDSNPNLQTVTYADGSTRQFFYNESAYTAGAALPLALTGIQDESNKRYVTYWYDASGHATQEQLLPQPTATTGQYQISYAGIAGPSTATGQSTVVDPLGSSRVYSFQNILGVPRLTQASQPAGAGCLGASNAQQYDGNGNITQRDDFDGHRACYAYDGTNQETTRIEGLSNGASCATFLPSGSALPAGSRRTSTQWHPNWRVPIKVAEPGVITTYVYNGQPDPFNGNATANCAPSAATLPDGKPIAVLCKKIEQATSDASGAQGMSASLQAGVPNRVWSYTYNQAGQILTATDPLNHTSTYRYYSDTSFTGVDPNAVGHTLGDLQSVTNAKNQVTSYTQYDKQGNLLQSTDPNGAVTSYSYDARQRLLNATMGGQTTSYTYWPTGLLKQVTLPDTSTLSYAYDDAHRLTGITDSLGNSITYTLDNTGNRIAENVKDSTGTLSRTLSRTVDALGRVQKITGRE